MAIGDELRIYPFSKTLRHTTGTTVWTAVQLYSWVQDSADEPGFMSYEEIIKFNTPTSFTMLNGWKLDNGDGSEILSYIKGGSIDTTGYATIDDPVYMLDLTSTTDWVPTDLDLTITDDAGDVGPLLSYLNDYPVAGSARIWVRDTNSNGTIATSSTIATATGTGAGTANGASVTGDEINTNVFTLAAFPSDVLPQVYIYQDHPQDATRTRIAEWSAFDNWDRGTIDVLIPVQLAGTLIDSGNVSAFVRQTGDSFTFVEVDLSSGSRTPIATETAADEVNITEGEWYLLYDAEAGGGFAVDDVIQDEATDSGVPPTWYAEVVAVTDDGTTGTLTLRGLRGTIVDDDPIYIGTTQRGLANGTPGDTFLTYSAEAAGPVGGDLGLPFEGVSSGAHRLLRGYQDDGTTGKLVLQVAHAHATVDSQDYTGTGRDVLYQDFSSGESVNAPAAGTGTMDITTAAVSTTLISGFSDVTVAHVNGTVTVSSTGTFTFGERITWNAAASEAIYISDNGTTMYLGNVDPGDEPDASDAFVGDISAATANCDSGLTDANTDTFNFTQQTANAFSVIVEGGSIYSAGRTLSDIYAYLQYYVSDGKSTDIHTSTGSAITLLAAEEYIKAVAAYAATKPAPFGTLAGTTFFGAQGVWVQGMVSTDENNVSLTDHGGTLRTPFTSVSVTVGNTRVDDVITVFLEDGSTAKPDKAQYTSHATLNAVSDSTFERDTTDFPIDTPTSGTFYVVDNTSNEEHRYRYDSWATTVLTLPTERASTATAAATGQTLFDTLATFQTWGIQRGDIIRNTTDGGWGYVLSVASETELETTQLTTAGRDWADLDDYEINSLVTTYDGSDTFFISYVDAIEDTGSDVTPGSITVTLLYDVDRAVVVRARNVAVGTTEIQPFVTTSDIESGGMNVSVIRNEDTVYTP